MKNPFKFRGFDSVVAKGLHLENVTMVIDHGKTVLIEGAVFGPTINMGEMPENAKVNTKTTLIASGLVSCTNDINVHNITVTGTLCCDRIVCEGVLAIQAGAVVKAREILYRGLAVEDGAVVNGNMKHLDHVSEGEQT